MWDNFVEAKGTNLAIVRLLMSLTSVHYHSIDERLLNSYFCGKIRRRSLCVASGSNCAAEPPVDKCRIFHNSADGDRPWEKPLGWGA